MKKNHVITLLCAALLAAFVLAACEGSFIDPGAGVGFSGGGSYSDKDSGSKDKDSDKVIAAKYRGRWKHTFNGDDFFIVLTKDTYVEESSDSQDEESPQKAYTEETDLWVHDDDSGHYIGVGVFEDDTHFKDLIMRIFVKQ